MLDLTPRPAWFDDAGQPCRLVTYRDLNRDERRGDPAFQAVADRAGRAFVSTSSRVAMFLPAMAIPIGGNLVHRLLLPGWPVWLVYLGMLVPLMPTMWFITGRNLQRCAGLVADALLADGLCPSCLYNLADQPTDDRLAHCPECGAIWRATRIARRHRFAAAPESEAAVVGRWWRRTGSFDTTGPTRITDDHGREQPIVHSRWRCPSPTAKALTAEPCSTRGARSVRTAEANAALAVLAATMFGPGFFLMLSFGGPLSVPRVLTMIGFAVFILFAPLSILALGSTGIRSAHIHAAMLRRRLCPSCAGDLGHASAAAPDGGTACPSCGAVWNLNEPDTGPG